MKNKIVYLFLGLSLTLSQAISQNYEGAEAQRLITGSELVRLGETSPVPEFVRLRQQAMFPAAQFPAWARKAFKLKENIGFSKIREEEDGMGMQHVRYQITNNGIPVFGAFVYTHGSNDMIASINGKIPSRMEMRQPILSEQTALGHALDHVAADLYKWELPQEEKHLKWESGNENATYFPQGELVYINPDFDFKDDAAFRLAYKFDVYAHSPLYRAYVFVDAQTGEILFENHRIHIADAVGTAQTGYVGTKTIITDSYNGSYRLREAGRGNGIRTFDMKKGTAYGSAVDFTDADNNWNNVNANYDQYATDAHWGAEMTYDYYLNEHARNSIDGNNMQINSYIHYDVNYFNAFWDGQRMTYGDGSGNPLTALDICGHEMTHGVTENTAGLIYMNEYGALNESFSDIFGASVEFKQNPSSGDWLMGEDVGILRSMSNPPAYGDPDTYTGVNWATGTADEGGVHTNSGVQNKWYYILVEGESGTNDLGSSYNVTGIGLDDAQAIAYRNLTVYLGPTSQYADARFYSIQSAIDLFGGCSPQVIATTNAWYAVGVGDAFNATVVGNFAASMTSNCEAPATISFTNLSTNGSSFSWDFGDGSTSTDANPTHTYSLTGNYTVTLMVDGDNCGTATETKPNFISLNPTNPCVAVMPSTGSRTLNWCSGTLYDDGGANSNYRNMGNVVTTISPPGATSVILNFSAFGFEDGYDFLYVYDGPSTNSPLLGQFTGFGLPNGGTVTSTGSSITIRQNSDPYVNELGFALTWQCVQPNSPPTAAFAASSLETCNGQVSFSDLSINGVTSWFWDFGDGQTSTAQNPSHTYEDEGTYTVTLTATNSFGNNILTQNNYITVDHPAGPSATGNFRCDAGTLPLYASGNGVLSWFNQPSGGTPIATGASFNTPLLNSTATYYVQNAVAASTYNVGPTNNTFGTGSNFEGSQHLLFDAYEAFTLKTVKVYAQGSGNRTIQLRSNSGTVLQSLTVNIPAGQQVVTLNFPVQPGNNYQLGLAGVPNLYRNNSGASYPYTVANIASIKNSSAGTDYYYSFYDWQIETPSCISERTAVTAEIAAAPSASNASRCGPGSVPITAAGSGNFTWYDAASGGTPLGTGSSFNTPSINSNTSFFVESEILPPTQFTGPTTNAIGSGVNFTNLQSLLFDCYEQATLVSVKVYAQGAGNRTIELRNASGTVIQSATVNIPNGESRVTLNFNLPVGANLQLGTSAGPNLYRNDAGVSFPYTIPGTLSITSSTAGNGYYYFFYDWEVQQKGCVTPRTEVMASIEPLSTVTASENVVICQGESVDLTSTATNSASIEWSTGEQTATITVSPTSTTIYSISSTNSCGTVSDQVEVTVNPLPTVPTVSANGADLTSSSGASYQWYLNGILIGNATDQTYTPSEEGDYSVRIFDPNGCSSISAPYTWITVGISENSAGPRIYPNPFNTYFLITTDTRMNTVEVMDASGRRVLSVQPLSDKVNVETKDWPNGVYFIRLTTQNRSFVEKVVKTD